VFLKRSATQLFSHTHTRSLAHALTKSFQAATHRWRLPRRGAPPESQPQPLECAALHKSFPRDTLAPVIAHDDGLNTVGCLPMGETAPHLTIEKHSVHSRPAAQHPQQRRLLLPLPHGFAAHE